MSTLTLPDTARALADGGAHDVDRLTTALAAAEKVIRRDTPVQVADEALGDFLRALMIGGVKALDGGDPQRLEDLLVADVPQSPLAEQTLRLAWLALADHLARTGDKPPFGGNGTAETWAMTVRSQHWPFIEPEAQVQAIVKLFGAGQHVVIVRGPGRSAFLAAVRRALLGAHGVEVLVPPVLPAARDDIAGLLRPYVARTKLDEKLAKALPQLQLGEDLVGVLGRAGDTVPVALLLDDAHLHSRSHLLGLPLFLEPADKRDALLVVSGPEDAKQDGSLSEIIADARERELLTEITLPEWDADRVERLATAWFGEAQSWSEGVVEAGPVAPNSADRLRVIRAWIAALTDESGAPLAEAEKTLTAGFDLDAFMPAHLGARRVLSAAALEGQVFHAFGVGTAFGNNEDFIEDLLYDDEMKLDDELVGTCENAVPPGQTLWADLPDGLHPVFRFADARVVCALRARLTDAEKAQQAAVLLRVILEGYGPLHAWQIADDLWRLETYTGIRRQLQQLLIGTHHAPRVEAGFGRLLPVLNAKTSYRLALSRLYGAAMEAGSLGATTGRVQLADQGFQAAAAAAQRLARPGPAGEALARLGEVRLALALPVPARQALELAEKLLVQAKQPRSQARVQLLHAETLVLEGNIDAAIGLMLSTVETLEEMGDAGHAALGLSRIGRLKFEQGHIEEAVGLTESALEKARAAEEPRAFAAALMARAFMHSEQGELDPAFKLLNEASEAFQKIGMPVHIVEVAAAGLQRRHGGTVDAEQRLRKMAELFKKAGAAVQWADSMHEVARSLIAQEKFTEAGTELLEVIKIRERARDRFGMVRAYEDLAEALVGQGDSGRALFEFARGRRLAERTGMAGRMGRLDAQIALLVGKLDGESAVDASSVQAEAASEIDEMEARWAAPPQMKVESKTVH